MIVYNDLSFATDYGSGVYNIGEVNDHVGLFARS